MRPCSPSSTKVAATGVKAAAAKQAFDSRRVADGDCKASLYGDDSELTGSGEGVVVVVTVHTGSRCSDDSSRDSGI